MFQTLFISHRGESADAPENTLQAFRLAMARDTDGMECDIRLTADRQIVVSHDGHTGRMGSRMALIHEENFEALRQINMRGAFSENAFVQMPTLNEVLEELREGKVLFIEIKPGQNLYIVPAMKEILEKSGIADDQIVLLSFDASILAECKKLLPAFRTLWLTGARNRELPFEENPEDLVKILQKLKADGVAISADETLLTRSFIQTVRNQGFFFAVWTVDGTEQARRLAANGADAIISNRAAEILRQLSCYENTAL